MEHINLTGQVLHVVSPEKAVNYKWEDNADKLPDNLQIISIDDYNSLADTTKKELFGLRNVSENSLLILEPYSHQYILPNEAEITFFDRKFNALSQIASLLGASKISMKVESYEETKRELSVNGDISYKAVDISATMNKAQMEHLKNKYEKIREYTSPRLTSEGFNEALRICEESGLIYDVNFKSLLAQRNPQHPNPMKKEILHIELSKELNESLDIAFHLNVLKGVFSLNAGVMNAISSSKRLMIETILEF